MDDLVTRLSTGDHAVWASRAETPKGLKEQIERNYVLIKFTETKGGTELGVELDKSACKFDGCDFESGKGTAHFEGGLILNYVRVRCTADIALDTLKGKGHLEILGEIKPGEETN